METRCKFCGTVMVEIADSIRLRKVKGKEKAELSGSHVERCPACFSEHHEGAQGGGGIHESWASPLLSGVRREP